MATALQTSLSEALRLPFTSEAECSVRLPTDIAYGDGRAPSLGSLDGRPSRLTTYQPIFPIHPVTMKLREVSIGKAWSTLHVELFQREKIAASADLIISNLDLPGITLPTGWQLLTPYHSAFYPDGYRRAASYLQFFIPTHPPAQITFVEQWIAPGWDCLPLGSGPVRGQSPARWTTEMVPFILDMNLPVQENFGQPEASRLAHLDGRPDWRVLRDDGSRILRTPVVNVTLLLSVEIKARLPPEGVRWLYMRSEAKAIERGRMDLQNLLFDERIQLVAISHQVAHLIPAAATTRKL
ncbi:hypothetical protein BO78DRAFT_414032 [Aspergillus sclerotiicarbonarius CBS 121057]|uniref:Acyl-CoA thioesterase-like C-terminal domain-containing protein n=1 Tax=Aspergillus sclerotiicarbonarius (strain CBS 121057 / IBT 28362) TaxID=1448318 RepID=A0A319ESR2_ASPSB|nr:hypothetical protein BO78DRAFT_414032 [Aspergillus sclerotiicarbonarius CBS 121057]